MAEAFVLLEQERFAGSIYLAGRAVEGMLRALIWKSGSVHAPRRKSLETGHDLRALLTRVRDLGVLGDGVDHQSIAAKVQRVGRLWFNNMRFLPTAAVEREWRALGEIGGKRTIKGAARDFYDACSAVVKRCEALW